MKESHHKAELI